MGANMIPITKKRGNTVLGVRIGLRSNVRYTEIETRCDENRRAILPCFQSLLPESGIYHPDLLVSHRPTRSRCSESHLLLQQEGRIVLAGLLLFCFLDGSGSTSLGSMDSVCSSCVGDMVVIVQARGFSH